MEYFGFNLLVFLISCILIGVGMLILCGIEKIFISTNEEDEEEDDGESVHCWEI